jgi:SpoVK/Ycf46/Vps4 family AAA+-type ATPase
MEEAAARLAGLALGGASAPPPPPPPPPAGPSASAALPGMEPVLEALREAIAWPARYAAEGAALGVRWPRGLLLHGPPGCGKSAAVRAVAAEAGASLHVVTAATIFGAYTGESEAALRGAFAAAEAAAAAAAAVAAAAGAPPGAAPAAVLFLDEADALCPRRSAARPHEARVAAQLLTLLDGAARGGGAAAAAAAGRVVVVAATARPDALDAALRRPGRLDREVGVPPPDAPGRAAILALLAARLPLAPGVDLAAVAARCHGYSGADLGALCREAAGAAVAAAVAARQRENSLRTESGGNGATGAAGAAAADVPLAIPPLAAADFLAAMGRVGASAARGAAAAFPPAAWGDVGGLEDVKRRLRQAVVWPSRHAGAFARLGLAPPRGVLLHGPPGCAKTTLARAAATASGATFIPLSGPALYSMYVGEGEAALREAFRRARLAAPAIVFVDELDAVVGARGEGSGSGGGADGEGGVSASARLLATFLTEMDGLEAARGVLVLAATNRPGAVDAALLRPGRFDVVLFVPPPDAEGRAAALAVHASRMPLAPDVDLAAVAAAAERYTGAELAAVCREAAFAALREGGEWGGPAGAAPAEAVAARHFAAALAGVRPALSAEELARYAAWPPRRGAGALGV